MNPSQDSLAILLLCSQLALADDETKPLTLREWNPLARKLQAAALRPASLLDLQVTDLQRQLALSAEVAARIALLVDRAGALQASLERCARLGIFPLTRADADYPQRYRERLKDSAPSVLFYAGEQALLGQPGIAVVGSRRLDDAGQECARFVGNACGLSGQVLYSGGARGVDTLSMDAALEARGTAVGVLADSLEKSLRAHETALRCGDLCLVTPYSPNAGFSVGAAMGRNRLIYCLADYAIVVASDAGTGGTWSGASETLKNGWVPVFVLEHADMPDGNRELLKKGALPFPHPFTEPPLRLPGWLQEKSASLPKPSNQMTLF
ncbi:predicted Rossmann fold nucleotide-binding protein [Longilinea arvoryzae]|uniref:Predicted Rossmann fold nucleotide-binding protein n=1 Tax=Longilinea arvoryzae TaxID=360412 RepID=A0A0S7BDS5_9CHLR|nr:DNA-processing protein DprA [Longilinea arvoryzae]GAP12627.1 predicted Rossmann fold nucleotide-binding protein [Longilinea arvoryzae]